MKHARVTTITPITDTEAEIKTESYHESLKSVKVETQQSIYSSIDTLLLDVIKCLEVITGNQSDELTITIKNDHGVMKILKRWTVEKQKVE